MTAACLALVERGTVRIDAYADNTGDKTAFDGHVYSDKGLPGHASLVPLGVLWLAVAITLLRIPRY